jgi:hypothetical protein
LPCPRSTPRKNYKGRASPAPTKRVGCGSAALRYDFLRAERCSALHAACHHGHDLTRAGCPCHSGRDARASAPESAPGWRGGSPLQVNVTCNRLQLRRGDTGWGAAGGERLVRTIRNSIRPVGCGEPASEWRSPEFPLGVLPWGSNLGSTRRGVTCPDEAERPQVVGDGMVGRPGA